MKEKIKLLKISSVFNKDLVKGMRNNDVKRLQQVLATNLEIYPEGLTTGFYGNYTENAVRRFQLKYNVIQKRNAPGNGRTGPKTRAKLQEVFKFDVPISVVSTLSTKKEILKYPPPESKCLEVFGDPLAKGWENKNIVRCDLSMFRLELEHVYLGWKKPENKAFVHKNWFGFSCHKLVAPKFQAAFKNAIDRKLAEQIKTFDGCFNIRKKRRGTSLSMHSWGIAIDLNAKRNLMGQKNFEMSEELAKCFEDVGFIWGGRWTARPDAMHFQYATVK